MKRVAMFLLLAVLSLSAAAQTEKGQSSIGLNIGYGFDSSNATLGLDYRYNVTDAIRLAPSLSFLVQNNGVSAVAIDMNAHYVVKLSEMFGFYPLAGVNLSFWDLAGWSFTRLGANLGLGAEVYASKQITVGLEVKYNIIKTFDQALMGVRVGYNF